MVGELFGYKTGYKTDDKKIGYLLGCTNEYGPKSHGPRTGSVHNGSSTSYLNNMYSTLRQRISVGTRRKAD